MQYLDKTGLARLWNNIKSKLAGKEDKSNKVTSITSSSTDIQYPSAKAVKDYADKKQTYSTNEIVVGTWIDGKPIYRKVLKFDTLSFAAHTNNNVPHNIANIGVVLNLTYDFYFSADTSHYIDWDGIKNKRVDDTNIAFTTTNSTSITFTNCKIIIEYTKTTD